MNNITIIGGGIIGLSVGWQLARNGKDVNIYDRGKAGEGAALVSAGMLAPQAEMGFEEIELFRLCRRSLEMYPGFLNDLESDTGIKVTLDKCGSIMVSLDRDDSERLRRLYDFREKVGLPVEWVTGSQAREIEPFLSPKIQHSIWVKDDAQIDNPKLMKALKEAFIKNGGKIHEHTDIQKVEIENNKITAIHSGENRIETETLIVANGAWSKLLEGIPEDVYPPVRPIKGQIITLNMTDYCRLSHAIRGQDVYLVPKPDGRMRVGASNEDMGYDIKPTAGEIYRMLERAWETVPGIYDLNIESIDVGLRPGSRDHEPIIGPTEVEGLIYATGHYRNGVLLAPVTAFTIKDYIFKKDIPDYAERYNVSRFHKQHSI